MQRSEQKKSQKKKPPGFSLKQRLLPVLLLAFAVSLTLFVFGPLEIYQTNADQFAFSLWDFLGWCLLYALGTAAIICAILLPLRGKVFDVVYALFLGIALMLMIQGNYLNFGISALTGDGTGADGFETFKVVINTIVWCAVILGLVVAALLIKSKFHDLIRTVGIIAMVTVIGMQTITLAVTFLTTQASDAPAQTVTEGDDFAALPHLLTYKNLDQVSANQNVIWFVIDRFDAVYYEQAYEECPELFYNLDGFTYFDDMTSLYPRTFPSIAYMLTGREHDFHDARTDYLSEAYADSEFLNLLASKNYNVNIYTDSYYGYDDARDMEAYISNSSVVKNLEVADKSRLSLDMTRLSLFRFLPIAAKNVVGNISTSDFQNHVIYEMSDAPKYDSSDMKAVYEYLLENPLTLDTTKNNFTFLHISGCHLPNKYGEDFGEVAKEDEWDFIVAMKQSFLIINLYIDQLKALGLYENATIIITGDHGWLRGSDTRLPTEDPKNPMLTALFVKESGSSGTPLVTNSAPVMQADIIPTILKSEGIDTDIDFGRSVFEIQEGEARVRKYNFQSWRSETQNYEVVEYEINGLARDLGNWTIVNRYFTESIYH